MSLKFLPALLIASLSAAPCETPPKTRPSKSFEQSDQLKQANMSGAYNTSARNNTRASWDLYVTGNYIFWQPMEENLELGVNASTSEVPAGHLSGTIVQTDFKYKSGFQAGIGIFPSWDNWDAYAQYTWFTGRHFSRSNPSPGQIIIPFWGSFLDVVNSGNPLENLPLSGKSRWKLSLEVVDLNLGRSYYVGKYLTFRPFFGARAAWINQKYIASFTTTGQLLQLRNTTTSWGVGLETGLLANYLLGCGFKLIGSAEADLLYTSYNLRTKQGFDIAVPAVNWREHHLKYLRPHMDLEFGFGWGSPFSNHNYYVDLSATYGFQVFWNQNMFRSFGGPLGFGTKNPVPNGDLYIHGLTAQLRFDF